MWMNVLTWAGLLMLGGALVVVVGAILIAAIEMLQKGGRDD